MNKKTCQEKVSTLSKKNSHTFHLFVNNGRDENKKRLFRAYQKGDNDYYWLHMKETSIFFVIPEDVLYERGILANPGEIQPKKIITVNMKNNKLSQPWMQEYMYDYENIEVDKLMDKLKSLFNVCV